MSCTCLEKVRLKLQEHHHAEVELELKRIIDGETLELSAALPPIYYTYTVGKKRKRSFVVFKRCPFCGEKMDQP